MQNLTMYSPLSEMKALSTLLAGDAGRDHQVCSPLQYEKCRAAKCCMRYELRDLPSVKLSEQDFRFCTPMEFSAARMAAVKREDE